MTECVYLAAKELSEIRPISVSSVLKRLGVSRSGYYDWLKREDSPRRIRKKEIQEAILSIYEKNHRIYGAPKITIILNRNGILVCEKTVSEYMREMGIKARYIGHYTKTTFSEDFSNQLQNILDQNFSPNNPNEAWCTDITYIWTIEDEFVYLCTIMDLFSRKIIAWDISDSLCVESVIKCIETAKTRRKTANPVIIQSDRCVQYTSEAYRQATENFILSYSHKGYPYDNACIEAFHSLIKREWLSHYVIDDIQRAKQLTFEYIETFYNTVRIHSHCGYVSPNEFERIHLSKQSEVSI